jgi:Peptidase family S41/N-terminal domain of Peptidase_S41 in eukaryotic IRBP
MSEKLYAWLLRLYPAHFREAYGDEALQLFRDRARDEKGFFPRLRLWLDLLLDVTISVPREYFHVPSPRVAALPSQRLYGVPSLFVLQDAFLRPGALLSGGVLSAIFLTTCWVSLSYSRTPSRAAFPQSGSADSAASSRMNSDSSDSRDASSASRSLAPDNHLDPAERKRVLDNTIANLKAHYVDRDAAQKVADVLMAHEKHGDYDSVTDRAGFAAILTRQMWDITSDRHLSLDYFQDPLPQQPVSQTPQALAGYRENMKQQNCTFEKVELLPRNIGYLKLNSFPDPEVCSVAAMAAMTYVNHADALIFDLRDNLGGNPEMVQFLGAYLFDHPEYWYNPRENTTERSWTRSPVPGSELADKPVFVLTSSATFSGAEQFCYDLKMLKRATLVGETTGGASHAGIFHRIDDHFGMGIPEVKAINPYSSNDWTGVGVEPDVKVKAADALETALKLARNKLKKN